MIASLHSASAPRAPAALERGWRVDGRGLSSHVWPRLAPTLVVRAGLGEDGGLAKQDGRSHNVARLVLPPKGPELIAHRSSQ